MLRAAGQRRVKANYCPLPGWLFSPEATTNFNWVYSWFSPSVSSTAEHSWYWARLVQPTPTLCRLKQHPHQNEDAHPSNGQGWPLLNQDIVHRYHQSIRSLVAPLQRIPSRSTPTVFGETQVHPTTTAITSSSNSKSPSINEPGCIFQQESCTLYVQTLKTPSNHNCNRNQPPTATGHSWSFGWLPLLCLENPVAKHRCHDPGASSPGDAVVSKHPSPRETNHDDIITMIGSSTSKNSSCYCFVVAAFGCLCCCCCCVLVLLWWWLSSPMLQTIVSHREIWLLDS